MSSSMMYSPASSTISESSQNSSHVKQYTDLSSVRSFSNQSNCAVANKYSPRSEHGKNNSPHLVITEQPVDKFRFRYKSEMHGTHGSLMAKNSEKSKKVYPTVELRGYAGESIIRCSLYQTDTLKRSPHSHRLVVRKHDVDYDDPHDLIVENGASAVFQGMGIIHTAKKYIVDELYKKRIFEKKIELGQSLTSLQESKIKRQSENEAKNMNLNQVCLCFQAFVKENGVYKKLCEPVYSTPINNMKSALTGELKITRLSMAASSAEGGDELILLVEKVGKKNIKVRFFELNDEEQIEWEAFGHFTEVDVHHQYAIALRTPKYKDPNITEPVDVFIQLIRPSDNDQSERVSFKYKPSNYASRKRQRMSSSANSRELPTTINQHGMSSDFESVNSADMRRIINELPSNELPMLNSNDLMSFDQFAQATVLFNNLVEDSGAQNTSVIMKAPPSANEGNSNSMFVQCAENIEGIYTRNQNDLTKAREPILSIINSMIVNGENILHWMIRSDNKYNIVKSLLTKIDALGIDDVLQIKTTTNQETCLHLACVHNRAHYIRSLINLGADPNSFDSKMNTPLHVAVELVHEICVSKIIERQNYTAKSKKLIIDCANHNGETALHVAVRKNNLKIVKALVNANASVKISDTKHGYTALHIAVKMGNKEIVDFLVNNDNVKINQTDNSGYTPLELAIAEYNDNLSELEQEKALQIIELLLKNRADPLLEHDTSAKKLRVDDLDDTDEDSSDNESQPAGKAFQMAKNKSRVLSLLNKFKNDPSSMKAGTNNLRKLASINFQDQIIKTEETVEDNDDDDDGELSISMDVEDNSGDQPIKFDEEAIIVLCKILNRQEKWKRLGANLGIETKLLNAWETSSNPTKKILLQIQGKKITVDRFVNVLFYMNEEDAVAEVTAMIARKDEPDDDEF